MIGADILISAEHYLHDQLHKHIKTDLLENVLELEKQPSTFNIGNSTEKAKLNNNATHECTTTYQEWDILQKTGEENSEQNNIANMSPVNQHSDIKKMDKTVSSEPDIEDL